MAQSFRPARSPSVAAFRTITTKTMSRGCLKMCCAGSAPNNRDKPASNGPSLDADLYTEPILNVTHAYGVSAQFPCTHQGATCRGVFKRRGVFKHCIDRPPATFHTATVRAQPTGDEAAPSRSSSALLSLVPTNVKIR